MVSSVGNNVADSWRSLLDGRSGIDQISKFDTAGYRSTIAGEVRNLDIADLMSAKETRRLDPFCQYAIAAADEAIQSSGIDCEAIDRDRSGVLIGSGIGGIITLEDQIGRSIQQGPSRVSPFLVPMMIGDMAAGIVAIRYNFRGPNFGVASACATGCHAIGEASWILRRGDADVMLAGGTEACVSPIACAGFSAMKALSQRNNEPQAASRPFDADRDGFVLADGAGVLVLETLEHALGRGAPILAELAGYGATGDAHHITSPPPDSSGAVAAIRIALTHANLAPSDIGYINAHGTGTRLNDKSETLALKTALGDHAYHVPISSTKSLTGHTLGAAGAIETIVCVKVLNEGVVPGTYNCDTPDPDCDLDYTPNESRECTVDAALNLNFGFGGHNAVLALTRLRESL